ncbi:MAG: hypothetical protein KDC85_15815 [Saprospiraceae bacterium]|nr:hypothetical protein [Saprospiraceae bacterium]MCB9326788.1 hypothetical protein [Lewinellaceae bacterium]
MPGEILKNAAGIKIDEFSSKNLFEPLGGGEYNSGTNQFNLFEDYILPAMK